MNLLTIVLLLNQSELTARCSLRALSLEIPSLARETRSGITRLGLNFDSVGMCTAVRKEIESHPEVRVTVSTEIRNVDELVRILPCQGGQCSAIYRRYRRETAQVTVADIRFSASGEIPGSSRERTESWSEDDCPPFAADCDL